MTKMLFRSAHKNDIEAIHHLAEHSGYGLTTLPKDIELLKKRLAWSTASFHKKIRTPGDEYYLFVLEDTSTGDIVGTSAIAAVAGHDAPFYSYKVSKHTKVCHSLNIRSDHEVLNLVNDNQGHSEICTLYLDPEYRHSNNGLLLSRARFLFIAQNPNRFKSTVIAELRGVSDDKGQSPFWDHVGVHFFHMAYTEADHLTLSTNKQFIADLMPKHPIYVKLLDPSAQAVIGQPHPFTVPAMNILMHEGFRYNNYVDIFDAGPTFEAPRDQIRTVTESEVMTVGNITQDASSQRFIFILTNTQLDFRATLGHVMLNDSQKTCTLDPETAELLHVKSGDSVRLIPL